jgi:hypothetical protein
VAAASLLLLVAITERVPALQALSPLGSALTESRQPAPMLQASEGEGEAEIDLETAERADLAQPEVVRPPVAARGPIVSRGPDEDAELPRVDAEAPPVPIVDERRSLDRFFSALGDTARKQPGAITRILYYGDSVVASDLGTATLRRKLQDEFGDAGHGYILIANAWPGYFHNDVYRTASPGWKVSRVVGPYQKDGLYGLGGVSFVAPPGLRSSVGTAKEGPHGQRVSRFVVSHLKQPSGGQFRVAIDGEERETVDTHADETALGTYEVEVPDGPHEMTLTTGKGMTRLFGFVLERDTPGVVLDALGVVGARIRFLDKLNDDHWRELLEWRRPNLVVYQFGANESADGFAYPMDEYHRTMREVLEKVTRSAPNAGCLVVSAMDRARKEGKRLVTVPVIPLIVEEQRKVAAEVGCAFFDTFAAMGGKGSMAKWVRQGYGAGDFTHPTSWGAEVLGNWLFRALMHRYAEYRERTTGAR